MPLRYEASKRFARAHIISNNCANFFFCHAVQGLANQIFDARGYSEQSQFKSNVGHETLQHVSSEPRSALQYSPPATYPLRRKIRRPRIEKGPLHP